MMKNGTIIITEAKLWTSVLTSLSTFVPCNNVVLSLLARAMASEYFDGQRIATDQRKLHLREVLHTLFAFWPRSSLSVVSSVGASSDNPLYHDQCICLHPASRESSHRHGHSPSCCKVLGTSRHDVYGFRVARNLTSTTSLRALAAACSFSTLSATDATATPTRFTRTIP